MFRSQRTTRAAGWKPAFNAQRTSLAVVVGMLAMVAAGQACAARVLSDFNALWQARPVDTAMSVRALQQARGRYRVTLHPQLGIPKFLQPNAAFARGRAPLALRGPEAAARAVLRELAQDYGVSATQVDAFRVADTQPLGNGAAIVQFTGQVDGIELYDERVSVLLDADGSPRAIGGYVGSTAAVPAGQAATQFLLSPAQAIGKALAEHVDGEAVTLSARAATPDSGGYWHFDPSMTGGAGVRGLRAKQVFFRLATGLVPAYYLEADLLEAGGRDHLYGYVVSARDGGVLSRRSLTHEVAFSYRVWADPLPPHAPFLGPQGTGGVPHPTGSNDGFQPPFVAPALIALQNGAISTNDPWLPPGSTISLGNNVDAYADKTGGDGFDGTDQRAGVTAAGIFDRTYDTNLAPDANATQIQAAVTQLFYVNNWLHDWFYDAGFDEAAGNAQADNYGRGGLAGDRLLAEAQDQSGTDNANMSTPADGASPRMQMYVFTGNAPNRDGTIDNGIVAHEWGHYITLRLIPGLGGSQGGGMSEGLGDFHALLMAARAEDALVPSNAGYNGVYSAAGYAVGGPTGNPSFYFGIRRYPYSTDPLKNPLTFRHIATANPLPPAAVVPRQTTYASPDNAEVHNVGEVWANMMWACYAGLLADDARLTFAQAQDRMTRYLVGGYKMSPPSPTFVDLRDAMLTVIASQDMDDFHLCAQAFASRGLGSGAVAPALGSDTNAGLVESFSLAPEVQLVAITADDRPLYCDSDGQLDNAETGTLHVHLRNNGLQDSEAGTVTLSSAVAGVSFPAGATFALPVIAPTQEAEVKVPVSLAGAVGIADIGFTVNIVGGATTTTGNASVLANVDYVAQAAGNEDFESPDFLWQPSVAAGAGQASLWTRRAIAADRHVAFGPDLGNAGVTWLVSPVLPHTAGTPLSLKITHRHSFEPGWDGGVVDVSLDDGQTWQDIEEYTTATVYPPGLLPGGNPLALRRAFQSSSAGYPSFVDTPMIALDQLPAAAGDLRVRFGVATDWYVGAEGWEVDKVAFNGLAGTPFESTRPHQGQCLQIQVLSGAPQSAMIHAPYAWPLEVRVIGADLLPRAGLKVSFQAPLVGASSTFQSTGDNASVAVTDADGGALSPEITANGEAGEYVVLASAGLQSVGFALKNLDPLSGSPPRLSAASDSGRFEDDAVTNATEHAFVGTCVSGATVTLIVDGVDEESAPCAADAYAIATSLSEGVHHVAARFAQGADTSTPTTATMVVVDRTVAAPTVTGPVGIGSLALVATGSGAEADAMVTVQDGSTTLCTAQPAIAGTWMCAGTAAAAGLRSISAYQTDLAGNRSEASAPVNYTAMDPIFVNGFE